MRLVTPLLLLCSLAFGAKVRVQDTLYRQDGTALASGTLYIAWRPFVTAEGKLVPSGYVNITVTAGVVDTWLEPATYEVRYGLTNSLQRTVYWVVPISGVPVTISAIETPAISPLPVATLPLAQLYFGAAGDLAYANSARAGVALAIGTSGKVLTSNGTAPYWADPGAFVCPTCVLTTGTYPDPAWITSLGWGKVTGAPTFLQAGNNLSDVGNSVTARTNISAAAATHTHAAGDIASGLVATARLGTGTASSGTFLRGDQLWATVAGGGNVTGPASAVDGNFASYNGITGTFVKDSGTSPTSFSGVGTCTNQVVTATVGNAAPTCANVAEPMFAFTDITTGNVSITAHGLAPKAPNIITQFLRGDGTWAVPSGTGDVLGPATNTDNYIPQWNGLNSKTLKNGKAAPTGDIVGTTDTQTLSAKTLTIPAISDFTNATHNHSGAAGGGTIGEGALSLSDVTTNDVSATKHGLAPKHPNDTGKYLRGDGTWASVPGSSGFDATRTSATVLTISGSGNKSFGNKVCAVNLGTAATVTLAAGAGSGTAYIYLKADCVLYVGHNLVDANVTCNASCTKVASITAFPSDSVPLWTWTATTANWDLTGGADRRASGGTKNLVAGTGTSTTENADGSTTVALDGAAYPAATGTWDAAGAVRTAPAKAGISVPGTCTTGDVFFKTDATAGQNLYFCTATNVYTQMTGGGGSHAVLSATHTDTTAGTVARGDIITGQTASPTWQRLAKGTAGQLVGYDGTDVTKTTVQDLLTSDGTNLRFNPLDATAFTWREDFIPSLASTSALPTGFRYDAIQGTNSPAIIAGVANHPGLFQFVTGATTGDGGNLIGGYASTLPLPPLNGLADLDSVFIVSTGSSVASMSLRVGFTGGTTFTAVPTTGCWIRFDTTVPDTTFKYECVVTGTSTVVDSTVTPAINTWYRLRIWATAAGTIQFSINGANANSIATNVPAVAVGPIFELVTREAVAKTAWYDFFAMRIRGLSR